MMKNYIAPISVYEVNGKVECDLYGCYQKKEFNHNQRDGIQMDNVYLVPTKEALKTYGARNLHVAVLIGLSKPSQSNEDRFKGGWNYKAKDARLIPYLKFRDMVGIIPRFYTGRPIQTDWNVFGNIIVNK